MEATMQRKRIDPQARVIHTQVGKTLRKLMNDTGDGKGIGIIRLAKHAGIGVGSVQSILNDPDHSPSLRVLDRLSKYFKLNGVWTLVRGLEYEDEVNTWLANNKLPFKLTQDDILRIQKLCRKIQSFDAVAFALGASQDMSREEFELFLGRLERAAG
jgi:transcriptional regulator with XRE-family HTH domain